MKRIDWNSDHWGDPATCVHYAANGSWVLDQHDATEAVQS